MRLPKISHAEMQIQTLYYRVIPADVRQPDEAALPATRNGKYASKPAAVELLVVFLSPALPVRRRLDEPRFQMPNMWTPPCMRIA
jgi:hypothetical protein